MFAKSYDPRLHDVRSVAMGNHRLWCVHAGESEGERELRSACVGRVRERMYYVVHAGEREGD